MVEEVFIRAKGNDSDAAFEVVEQVFEGAERLIRREEEEERLVYCKGCESERVGNKICPLERAGCGIAESYQDIRFLNGACN